MTTKLCAAPEASATPQLAGVVGFEVNKGFSAPIGDVDADGVQEVAVPALGGAVQILAERSVLPHLLTAEHLTTSDARESIEPPDDINGERPVSCARRRCFIVCVLLLDVFACAAPALPATPEQRRARQVLANLTVGTPYAEVIERLGEPEKREAFRRSPDRNVLFLFYRIGPLSERGTGPGSGLEPVAIEYGRIERKGWSYYNGISTRFSRLR